jgi:murein L,D-transpeptidase YcbB/YkuD
MSNRLARLLWAALLACTVSGAGAEGLRWFDGGRPSAQAQQAVQLLQQAAEQGLEPRDYAAVELQQAVQASGVGPPPDAARVAQIERGLTLALQRYLGDLHRGRVDPQRIGHGFDAPPADGFDAAAVLREALAAQRLPQAAADAAPQLPQYAQLRRALADYRAMGDAAAWNRPLPPLPPGTARNPARLEPGQGYAGLALLAERLALLGDRPAGAPLPSRYEGALVDAVKAFQQRHGLAPDGVIGKATLAALQVAPAARARQIELALERLRWTPLLRGPRMVVINVPEFVLRAYEVDDGGRIVVRRQMRVIVGRAYDTRTPLFEEPMRFIEFSPFWNVPPSIARGELLPKLRRDPAHWEREGFEFVADDGQVETALSAQGLQAVQAGQWRIRQRPGPRNALGDIKFVFPNRDHIYLHHTPSTQLFERTRRDFSHGCIRVEQPVELATFVLQGMPGWDEARIREAMEAGRSSRLRLQQPVPVLIAYGTALFKSGRMHFFDDLYGHDRVLDATLRQRPALAWSLQ